MSTQVKLTCAAGLPLAFRRIYESHGLAGVSPWERIDTAKGGLGLVVTVPTSIGPRTLRIECDSPDAPGAEAFVSVVSDGSTNEPVPCDQEVAAIASRILGLGRDLSDFHDSAAADSDLDWVPAAGAGAMARGATVFEDVIRTILTTNCSWAMTIQMCSAMVEQLGDPDPFTGRKAFPTAEAIAGCGEQLLKDEVRVGYRAPMLIESARLIADGEVDLELLGGAPPSELPDAEVERVLRSLPGIGPYAAAHTMLLIGRPSLPILDSWTRPKYARITGRKSATDAQILKRVKRHGPNAGLALWLILTRDWFKQTPA
jgi:3-methyladenine DNA glycosylase/8-oxoguanine DNA glycosylase